MCIEIWTTLWLLASHYIAFDVDNDDGDDDDDADDDCNDFNRG